MFLINVLVLCCVFKFYRISYESEALILYDPRSRYYSYDLARDGYGRNYDQEKIKIYLAASAKQPKKTSYKSKSKTKTKTQPAIDLSFEPLGALKIDSLTHGEIEFNPEALDDVLLSIASGTLSMAPDLHQYVPSLSSLYGGDELAQLSGDQSRDESSRPKEHRRNSDRDDDASEENSRSSGDHDDESGKKDDNSENSVSHEDRSEDKSDKSDYDKKHEDDDDNAAEEQDFSKDHSKSKHSRSSEHHENNSQDDKNEPASENKNSHESSKNSKEKSKEDVLLEILAEDLPPQEGYVDKFVKYYSYAKPIAKAASLFVPGLGQYKGVMFGMEMASLAYETATMYQNGDGYLSIGWHLGKETFKRLGRRSEPLQISKVPDTKASSVDIEEFLDQVKNTQYPFLDEEKEQKIKSSVAKIVRKYFHDLEEYKNKTERIKFIDLMVSCVKFVALQQIIPTAKD